MTRSRFHAGAAAIALAALALVGCVDTESVVITMPDLSRIADGAYDGEYTLGPVKVKVTVEVAGGRIASFTILKHEKLMGGPAERLAPLVVERQTVALDAVSGATASSKAILKAGQLALEKGLQ